jgi:hypothetical protein
VGSSIKEKLYFKEIELGDYKHISNFLKKTDSHFCELTPGSLFMWSGFFKNRICTTEDALIVFGYDTNDLASYMPPICTKNNEREILQRLYHYAKKEHGYLKIYPIAEEKIDDYKDLLCESIGISHNTTQLSVGVMEDWFDYVYTAEDLKSLSGKKLHGQRNYVNRFLREHNDYSLEPIGAKNIDDVRRFIIAFSKNTESSPLADYENEATLQFLDKISFLEQESLVLRAEGSVIGFIVGETIGNMLYEHIEKADRNFIGAYPFLKNSFIRLMMDRYPGITLVNFEEDLGDKGLRYAKECYHPIKKLYKHYIKI